MKVIDLLNKIANGEEVPKKIKYKYNIYYAEFSSSSGKSYYCDDEGDTLLLEVIDSVDQLNDEVEIIEEDKKIENIGANNYEWNYKYDIRTPQAVVDNLELVRQKINEIIKHLNKGE